MPNALQQSVEKATDLRSNPFWRARVGLTAIYVVLLICALLISAGTTYSVFARRIQHRFAPWYMTPEFARETMPRVEDVRSDLLRAFVLGNAGLVVLAGLVSYWLAGLTLRPIERAYERQRQFVGDASHELRTPLAILRTSVENELQHADSAKEKHLRDDLQEIDRMSALVADLLALSRLDGGVDGRVWDEVDLSELVTTTTARFAVLATEHEVSLKLGEVPSVIVWADRELLVRAMGNIVKNAILYNKVRGEIMMSITRRKREAVIEIRDTGIGIAAEDLPHVFDRFYRVDTSRSRATGGSGLGLAIVQSAITACDGRVDVESEYGIGTTVRVTLPIHKASS